MISYRMLLDDDLILSESSIENADQGLFFVSPRPAALFSIWKGKLFPTTVATFTTSIRRSE